MNKWNRHVALVGDGQSIDRALGRLLCHSGLEVKTYPCLKEPLAEQSAEEQINNRQRKPK
jgi:FixJ family two-component response regulator